MWSNTENVGFLSLMKLVYLASCEKKVIFTVKPTIDRSSLSTTTVKVGKQIFLDVDVMGEPAPGLIFKSS